MRIKLKYPDVETFIQKYSVNISRGGIFIATRSPKAVGTLIRFEFQLATAAPIIRGEGQVIWVKAFDPDQPKKVHGMGVRFTRLDSESRSLVDRALNWKRDHQPDREAAEPDSSLASEAHPEPAQEAVAATEAPGEPSIESPGSSPGVPAIESPGSPSGELASDISDGDAEVEVALPRSMVSGGHEIVVPAAPLDEPPDRQDRLVPAPYLDNEAVAELWQSSQSNIVRAARHIAELTAANVYYPEDTELAELLKPLRIPLPPTGRDASRLLGELLASPRAGTAS